jgi:hypothetical protein
VGVAAEGMNVQASKAKPSGEASTAGFPQQKKERERMGIAKAKERVNKG